ncbi:hypothetical protein GGR42_002883 [Saonia flava]|uniref:DUF2911 domain-containing protein n=1 Tax=Saonia flava TaxID=523696 RepID=A0A846R0C0_9FLAO|nr:DUF2911 domain-containing protein [Saonia flava]NJB72392.1 hypothetical protein [Saonia flava]
MKYLKWTLIVLAVLILLVVFVGMPYAQKQTKVHSPETTSVYAKKGIDLAVKYSSPHKKGRVIFGELVPYDVVWRTGANEPTTFTTKTNIKIIDKDLPAGTYSLWTRPKKDSWDIMFNSEVPDWGVTIMSGGKKTTRNPETDVVQIEVPVETLQESVESFTIRFDEYEELYLILSWDKTKVSIPINK